MTITWMTSQVSQTRSRQRVLDGAIVERGISDDIRGRDTQWYFWIKQVSSRARKSSSPECEMIFDEQRLMNFLTRCWAALPHWS